MPNVTILPPMACRGYETFDANWNRYAEAREEAMCGRDRGQLAFQDRQMAYIEHKLKEIGGYGDEEVDMPLFVYREHKNGNYYGGSVKVIREDGTIEKYIRKHVAAKGTTKPVSSGRKGGREWLKLTNRPTVPRDPRYGLQPQNTPKDPRKEPSE